jgi:hypothetical protein
MDDDGRVGGGLLSQGETQPQAGGDREEGGCGQGSWRFIRNLSSERRLEPCLPPGTCPTQSRALIGPLYFLVRTAYRDSWRVVTQAYQVVCVGQRQTKYFRGAPGKISGQSAVAPR